MRAVPPTRNKNCNTQATDEGKFDDEIELLMNGYTYLLECYVIEGPRPHPGQDLRFPRGMDS